MCLRASSFGARTSQRMITLAIGACWEDRMASAAPAPAVAPIRIRTGAALDPVTGDDYSARRIVNIATPSDFLGCVEQLNRDRNCDLPLWLATKDLLDPAGDTRLVAVAVAVVDLPDDAISIGKVGRW
jgi:hypothetical protein